MESKLEKNRYGEIGRDKGGNNRYSKAVLSNSGLMHKSIIIHLIAKCGIVWGWGINTPFSHSFVKGEEKGRRKLMRLHVRFLFLKFFEVIVLVS